ncbi:MAG: hypothetical protein HQ592_18460 [Planctomycetes bacterium]|nr:hypothetical protein [Planctomycetota bacterium]
MKRQLTDLLTAAMVTSAKIAVQEKAEGSQDSVAVAIGIQTTKELRKIKEFTSSPAYQHALKAYVDGTISLSDLARALEPLQPMMSWLMTTTKS